MRSWLKYLLASLAVALFLAVTIWAGAGWKSSVKDLDCNEIEVSFLDDYKFVDEEDVKSAILRNYGIVTGQLLDSVKLHKIEDIINSQGAVLKSQAWTTPDGVLHISVTQRAPVARLMNGDKGWYIDNRGFLFPLHPDYTAPVLVIEGDIPVYVATRFKGEAPTENERKWISGVLALLPYLKDCSDVRYEKNGDFSFKCPRGQERIIIGPARNLEDKFSRLDKYYTSVVREKGAGYYSTVNLKYDGQIVCRK